jgi:hypothetical protein
MSENAVYRFYNSGRQLLYVGVTWNPALRFEQHRAEKWWFKHVAYAEIDWFPSRETAEDEEARAIWLEAPQHNIAQPLSRDQRIVRGAMELEPELRVVWVRFRRGEIDWNEVVARLPLLIGPGRVMPARSDALVDMDVALDGLMEHLDQSWDSTTPEPEHGFLADAYTLEVVMDLFLAQRSIMGP